MLFAMIGWMIEMQIQLVQFYRIMEAKVYMLRGHQLHTCLRAYK